MFDRIFSLALQDFAATSKPETKGYIEKYSIKNDSGL